MLKDDVLGTALAQIALVYQTCPFMQIRLLPTDRFVRCLRGRALHFRKEDLQEFEDILPPVQVSEGSQGSLYHPYQVWLAHKLVRAVSPDLVWSSWWTATPESLDRFIVAHRQRTAKSLQVLAEKAAEFYQLLALLVAVDPYCIPHIQGKVSLPILGRGKDNYVEYVAWRRSFDGKGIVSRSTLSVDQIKEWHLVLSVDAGIVNDAENWYLLTRHATFDKRDRLKGQLRLAFDFYEMAESLRILLRLAGEQVPAEDDYFGGGGWKTRLYGVEEINFVQRPVLKRIAREYGLDGSYRGFWFVEGPTEAGFVQGFSEGSGVSMEERGIALVNLGGIGDLVHKRTEVAKRLRGSQSFVEQLRRLKTDEIFAFITVDDDEGISEGLESLRSEGLLTVGFVKWQGDFEEANFTVTEVIQVLQDMATPYPAKIDPSEIEAERRKPNSAGQRRTLGEAVEAVARRTAGLEQFGKSEAWGRALAEYVLDHPNLGGELRPIIKAWRRALSMSYADFGGTVANLECTVSGDLIPRPEQAQR